MISKCTTGCPIWSPRGRCTVDPKTPSTARNNRSMMNSDHPLRGARFATRLPARDLDRARRFYSEKLGLEPSEERPGGLLFKTAHGGFALFAWSGASSGEFTQMGWEVDDIEATVAELKSRGVMFEDVDVPGLRTVHG